MGSTKATALIGWLILALILMTVSQMYAGPNLHKNPLLWMPIYALLQLQREGIAGQIALGFGCKYEEHKYKYKYTWAGLHLALVAALPSFELPGNAMQWNWVRHPAMALHAGVSCICFIQPEQGRGKYKNQHKDKYNYEIFWLLFSSFCSTLLMLLD